MYMSHLNWTGIFCCMCKCPGYQSILQRLISTSTMTVTSQTASPDDDDASQPPSNDLDLGFISHAQFSSGLMNYDVVRYMLHSGLFSFGFLREGGRLIDITSIKGRVGGGRIYLNMIQWWIWDILLLSSILLIKNVLVTVFFFTLKNYCL